LSSTSTIGTFLPNAALAASLMERLVLRPGFATASASISLRRLLAMLLAPARLTPARLGQIRPEHDLAAAGWQDPAGWCQLA
jgi:hypothetical protein